MIRGVIAAICVLGLGVPVGLGCGGSSDDEDEGTVPAASATVSTRDVSGYGTVLATKSGRPLYLLTADPSGGSKCVGSCAKKWRPLTEKGAPTAGPGVKPSQLRTFKRGDGGKQVLYNGHALYTSTGRGLTSAAGTASHGGTWFLVSPSGEPIETTEAGGY